MAMQLLTSLADRWTARAADRSEAAVAAVAGLAPAAVVTGASKGIGLALARRIAMSGAHVILVARDAGELGKAAAQILQSAEGARVETLAVDITQAGAASSIEEFARACGLYVDVLVNNAGVGASGEFCATDAAVLEELVTLNIAALTRLTRHVLPGMLARGRGGILNISSLGGYVPGPYQAAYYASKAYVSSLTEALRFETAGRGVRVAVVAPGPVETEFHREMGAERAFYRWIVPSLTADDVARIAWRGYRLGRGVIIPGFVNNLLAMAIWVLPNAILVPMVAALLAPGRPSRSTNP